MSHHISLETVDADGAIRDAGEAAGLDRSQLLRRGAVAGGTFLAGGVLFNGLLSPAQAAAATSRKSKRNDVKILNYALTLEYLEAEFYADALAANIIKDPLVLAFAQATGAHEAAHVKTLRAVLRSAAVKKPTFDFSSALKDEATFKATAQVLEDTGVSAYAGQGPNIKQTAASRPRWPSIRSRRATRRGSASSTAAAPPARRPRTSPPRSRSTSPPR